MIGKTILHYKIIEKLGEGGMGVVYKAEDTKLKREVAIKFLPRQIALNEVERERLKIEAQAAAAINHPNIATIYAIEETEAEIFIVMEYINGKELKEEIIKGQLSIDSIIRISKKILKGLKAAHDKKIIHRDIKSSNIMLTENDQVKVMDFGLAKIGMGTHLTQETSTIGTAAYMSPEQSQGNKIDHRSDIWSFGVVLYEMLSGETPFKGEYEQSVIYSILNEDPISVKEYRNDISPQLDQIIERSLSKNPEDRFQSAGDLLDEIRIINKSESSKQEDKITSAIAVLPFTNMSTDKEQEYFCDGIAEDILNELANIEDLHVVSRTSSFTFKNKNQDIREIGLKLGAQNILEGSVRKSGNRIRITAQLINVAEGYHTWSERYDRELEDVFAIQDEIAKSIVQALEIKLSKKEKLAFGKFKTHNVKAYDLYIRGRSYFNQSHHSSHIYAIDMFSQAIELDEKYTIAYTGLADTYSNIYMYFDRKKENLDKALEASKKALELDPELSEAHTSRGMALAQNNQYKEAGEEFKTAIELNPRSYEAFYEYARTCRAQGKHKQAATLFKKASMIRPEDYESAIFLVSAYNNAKMESEIDKANLRALKVIRNHLELNPDDARAYYLGAPALIREGRTEEAIQWIEKAVTIEPNEVTVLYNVTCTYALLGEIYKALYYFEKAIDAGFASMEWIDNDTDLDPIRDHPRFQKAIKNLK